MRRPADRYSAALVEGVDVDERSRDLAARWPACHRALVHQTPSRSVTSLPLRIAGRASVGALDLYSDQPRVDPAVCGEEAQTAIADQIGGLLLEAPPARTDWTDEPSRPGSRVLPWPAGWRSGRPSAC